MSQNSPPNFTTPNIPTDPLADFQAKMDELIAQANAQLRHPSPDTPNQPDHHQVPDQSLLPQQPDTTTLSTPPTLCPGRTPSPNSLWHGWPRCTICSSCFTSFVSCTPLAALMPLQNHFEPSPTVCDLYSPRQRALYLKACETGKIEEFLSWCDERSLVYQQTVGRIMEMEAEREAMLARAEMTAVEARVNRLIEGYSGLDTTFGGEGRAEGWRTQSGGVYFSWNGVVAEREEQEVHGLWEAVGSGEWEEEMERLERRWREVE